MFAVHSGRRQPFVALFAGVATVLVCSAPAYAAADIAAPQGAVAAGSKVRVQGSDLGANAVVSVDLNGSKLVALRANGDGTLDTQVALPAGLPDGKYSLSLSGKGVEKSTSVTVAGSAATASPAGLFSAGDVLAIPPGGAGANTPGTTSSVSPTSVAHGASLSFSVGGYPAGETVYVKIDDGSYKGKGITTGADIVAEAKIGSDGKASGSLKVPDDLQAGKHTLRFLASKQSDQGTLGYTHKSQEFTVTAAGSSTGGTTTSTSTPGSSTTTGTATTSTGTKTTTGSLAKTGAPLLGLAVVGGAGIVVGTGLLRRKKSRR